MGDGRQSADVRRTLWASGRGICRRRDRAAWLACGCAARAGARRASQASVAGSNPSNDTRRDASSSFRSPRARRCMPTSTEGECLATSSSFDLETPQTVPWTSEVLMRAYALNERQLTTDGDGVATGTRETDMRKWVLALGIVAAVGLLGAFDNRPLDAQQQQQDPAAPPRHPSPANMPQRPSTRCSSLSPSPRQEAYADLDGKRMLRDVVEQANIARSTAIRDIRISGAGLSAPPLTPRARMDDGQVQGGRLDRRAGSSRSTSARNGFRSPGRSRSGGGKTIVLDSAQPHYGSVAPLRKGWTSKRCTWASAARPTSLGGT